MIMLYKERLDGGKPYALWSSDGEAGLASVMEEDVIAKANSVDEILEIVQEKALGFVAGLGRAVSAQNGAASNAM